MLSADLQQALFASLFIMVFIVSMVFVSEHYGPLNVDKIVKTKVRFLCSIQKKQHSSELNYEHICGCSLIDNIFALTAAHCFMKYAAHSQYSVVIEENVLNGNGNKTRVKIMQIIKHPLFKPFMGYDIALIKLQDEINFEKVRFSETMPIENENLLLIGWEDTLFRTRKVLKILRFNSIPASVCNKRLKLNLTKADVCSISFDGRGALQGDSGSPVVDSKQEHLVGIVSYGRNSFNTREVFVFTAIKPFVNWINEQKAYLLNYQQ